jgi:hypothetical protein
METLGSKFIRTFRIVLMIMSVGSPTCEAETVWRPKNKQVKGEVAPVLFFFELSATPCRFIGGVEV